MNLFFAPAILTDCILPEPESQHCIRVLRRQKGDLIRITDGKGHFFNARIIGTNPKQCAVEIVETIHQPPLWKGRIEIAVAPTKNRERIEWFVEKAAETGIDKISLLRTRFSERKDIKTDRFNHILISAMKQSEQAILPELQAMTDFEPFIKQEFNGRKLIAHCYEGEKKPLCQSIGKEDNVLILIGPEGDFSEDEVRLATTNGFQSISLGNSRLRTETAALAACQTVHIVRQMLSKKETH
ncbi:MAG: 16S rRNA (uracil(1498)-N(3))-methyltransferase [Dysgonamonadaceae bacterium]|jgi:16S rRNA (uracil1498-N3)-methyltransferase|nr:16S rRNA (uracil(1498)-N(3))-methyltransferase [Dysgonamonadaceae bacterium]